MIYSKYSQLALDGTLDILLNDVEIVFRQQTIAEGHGSLKFNSQGQLVLSAEIKLAADVNQLPKFPVLKLIPVDRAITFRAKSPEGEEVFGALTTLNSTEIFGENKLSILSILFKVTFRAPVYGFET